MLSSKPQFYSENMSRFLGSIRSALIVIKVQAVCEIKSHKVSSEQMCG